MGSGILFYATLLVAVAAGWSIAWVSLRSRYQSKRSVKDIYHDYFVGLNYLLGDEPDEAIDTFIRALEINSDTIETHLALGTLLRRRGKVDKAIKVHQELLARPELDSQFSDSVRLELSHDYVAAGLLDRAEQLLKELLSDSSESKLNALFQLTTVYQIEKEWQEAIDAIKTLLADPRYRKDKSIRSVGAHFCCELAEQAMANEQPQVARDHIKNAFRFDRNSARASFLMARLEKMTNNLARAIKELVRIRNLHPEFISEIIEPMAECYQQLGEKGDIREFEKFLLSCLDDQPRASTLLKLVELVRTGDSEASAMVLLSSRLRQNPSLKGIVAMLQVHVSKTEGQLQHDLLQTVEILKLLLQAKPGYQCDQCGFETRSLYWQCSSCQKWDTVKPHLGIDGE